jgi:hypothetical protein
MIGAFSSFGRRNRLPHLGFITNKAAAARGKTAAKITGDESADAIYLRALPRS